MFRWSVALVLFALLVPGNAQAASPYAKATVARCDRDLNEAMFSGRVSAYRRSAKMQMRFTLQALTPDEPSWRKVDALGFGEWITVPSGFKKYTYDKTVQGLLAPASYRAVVHFRWRDARGKLIRSERAVSGVCRQPDSRPDLVDPQREGRSGGLRRGRVQPRARSGGRVRRPVRARRRAARQRAGRRARAADRDRCLPARRRGARRGRRSRRSSTRCPRSTSPTSSTTRVSAFC